MKLKLFFGFLIGTFMTVDGIKCLNPDLRKNPVLECPNGCRMYDEPSYGCKYKCANKSQVMNGCDIEKEIVFCQCNQEDYCHTKKENLGKDILKQKHKPKMEECWKQANTQMGQFKLWTTTAPAKEKATTKAQTTTTEVPTTKTTKTTVGTSTSTSTTTTTKAPNTEAKTSTAMSTATSTKGAKIGAKQPEPEPNTTQDPLTPTAEKATTQRKTEKIATTESTTTEVPTTTTSTSTSTSTTTTSTSKTITTTTSTTATTTPSPTTTVATTPQETTAITSTAVSQIVLPTGPSAPRTKKTPTLKTQNMILKGAGWREFEHRLDIEKKQRETDQTKFRWWYILSIFGFLVFFIAVGLVSWSALTKKKRSAQVIQKVQAKNLKKKALAVKKPKRSQEIIMETLPDSQVAKMGPLHLQKEMKGEMKHQLDGVKSCSLREKLEFDPTMNEEVIIGSDVEIIDGMDATTITHEESQSIMGQTDTVRNVSSYNNVRS